MGDSRENIHQGLQFLEAIYIIQQKTKKGSCKEQIPADIGDDTMSHVFGVCADGSGNLSWDGTENRKDAVIYG